MNSYAFIYSLYSVVCAGACAKFISEVGLKFKATYDAMYVM